MQWVKFVIVWLFVTVLCVTFESQIMYIFGFFDSGLNYVFGGAIGQAIKDIFTFIGGIFDAILLNPTTSYVTSTGMSVGNIVWVGTLASVCLFLLILKLFWKAVFK